MEYARSPHMDTTPPTAAATRRKGMVIFITGLAVFAFGLAVAIILAWQGYELNPRDLLILAIPGGYALSGLLEAITGVPFMQFARQWDELQGWQRGVIGTAIVLAAMAIIILGVGLCVTMF
jgi:hypothetical protein